jgi:quercetin dioxygenase-like cupin family protein
MTARRLLVPASLTSFLVLLPATALRAQEEAAAEMAMAEETIIVSNADVAYEPIEVPGFDSGMEIAILSGDPNSEGGIYTLRLAFPDGYQFPPHWHPKAENVTVVEGTFLLGMGESVDESAIEEYVPGDYLYIPPEHPHFGGAKGRTVVQLHGPGPFAINLVE